MSPPRMPATLSAVLRPWSDGSVSTEALLEAQERETVSPPAERSSEVTMRPGELLEEEWDEVDRYSFDDTGCRER